MGVSGRGFCGADIGIWAKVIFIVKKYNSINNYGNIFIVNKFIYIGQNKFIYVVRKIHCKNVEICRKIRLKYVKI